MRPLRGYTTWRARLSQDCLTGIWLKSHQRAPGQAQLCPREDTGEEMTIKILTPDSFGNQASLSTYWVPDTEGIQE